MRLVGTVRVRSWECNVERPQKDRNTTMCVLKLFYTFPQLETLYKVTFAGVSSSLPEPDCVCLCVQLMCETD